MSKEGHPDHCSLCRQRHEERIVKASRCACDDVGEGPCPAHLCKVCGARTADYSDGSCDACRKPTDD